MSASIAAAACIPQFLHFIDGEGIVSLMCTGNRQLRTMLRRNCTDLCFSDVLPGTKFPFEVLSMPHLRALSVIGIKEAPTFLDYRREDDLALSKGSTSLISLELDFRNCQGLFMHPRSNSPRLQVRERFPSLTTLKIHGMTKAKIPERLFGEFPETLQTLSIAFAESVIFRCDGISKLPRNMTSLSITGCDIWGALREDPPVVYPPNLLHLELSELHNADLVYHFPSTLRTLHFGMGISYNFRPKVFMSSLRRFSSLTSLVARGYKVILDEPIPHTLEEFDCEAIERADGSQYKNNEFPSLPKKMKRVPAFFGHKYSLETAFDALPNLEILEIRDENVIVKLPSGLKELTCKSEVQSSKITLPQGLTSLHLAVTPENFTGFGENSLLRKVHIGAEHASDILLSYYYGEPDNPKYYCGHFLDQLNNCEYLESISVNFGNLEDVALEALDWYWRFEFLTSITLRSLNFPLVECQPEEMANMLPMTLTELNITFSVTDSNYENSTIDDEFLGDWLLSTNTPSLRSLSIGFPATTFVNWGSSFDSLPEGLLKLELSGIGTLTVDACSKLPRSLKCLDLLLYHEQSRMTTKHFRNLPNGLARLYFEYCSPTIRERLFSILPKSVVEVSFKEDIDRADGNGDDDDWYQQMNDSARQFVRHNPLCHGYLPPYNSEFSDDIFDSDTDGEVDGEDLANDE